MHRTLKLKALLAAGLGAASIIGAVFAVPGAASAAPADVAPDIPNLTTPVFARLAGPAITDDGTDQAVAVLARGADNSLLFSRRSNSAFAPLRSLGGQIIGDPGAIATTSGVEAFVRGTDDQIYTGVVNSADAFSGYSLLPGGFRTTSDVEVTIPPGPYGPPTGIQLFARGQDGSVWTNVRRNGVWGGWTSLGGYITSEIHAVDGIRFLSPSGKNVRLAVRGGDNRVYRNILEPNGTMTGWQLSDPNFQAGGNVTGGAGGATGALYARGADGGVWRFSTIGTINDANKWVPLGGQIVGDVGVGGTGFATQITVRSPGGQLYSNRTEGNYSGAPWLGFQPVSGTASGNPAQFSRTQGAVSESHALVRDSAGNLVQYIGTAATNLALIGPAAIPGAQLG